MKIAVASGKGGTGKTLISTALALSIGNARFLDLDVEEPNAHIFLKPEIEEKRVFSIPVPEINLQKCTYCGKCAEVCEFGTIFVGKDTITVFDKLCHGCGGCTLACPENAIREKPYPVGEISIGKKDSIQFVQGLLTLTEALSTPLIRHIKKNFSETDVPVIMDAPPGTSCPFVQTISDTDFVILVTEPTPFGESDLNIAIDVVKEMGLRAGVIINRAGMGYQDMKQRIERQGIPVLLEIPFDRRIAEGYAHGKPLTEILPEYRERFLKIMEDIGRMV